MAYAFMAITAAARAVDRVLGGGSSQEIERNEEAYLVVPGDGLLDCVAARSVIGEDQVDDYKRALNAESPGAARYLRQ